MALVIIGVGVLAFVEAQKTFMTNNNWSSQSATANYLAGEIREFTRRMSRHDPVTGLWSEVSNGQTVVHGWGPEAGEIVAEDFDDLDDLDGMRFGADGDLPGPINAFGEIVPQTTADGIIVLDEQNQPVPLTGWSQTITVDKVDPFNFATVRAHGYSENANGSFKGRKVDQYPLRVTVVIEYQGTYDSSPHEVMRSTWVVP